MTAGPHLAERVVHLAAHHFVDSQQPGADRTQRRLPRAGRQHRIGIEAHGLLPRGGPGALDGIDVGLRMGKRDPLLHVVAQWRLDALASGLKISCDSALSMARMRSGRSGWPGSRVVLRRTQGCVICSVVMDATFLRVGVPGPTLDEIARVKADRARYH